MIRVAVNVKPRTRQQFIDYSTRVARQSARQELEAIGREWVEEVTKIVQAELPRRDGDRHKRNTTHLDQSFQYRIIEGPNDGFPMRLELTTKPGVNAKKIAALEFGNPDHDIPKGRKTIPLRWGDAPGDLSKEAAFMGQVRWTSTGPNSKGKAGRGYGFMRRARDRVMARRRAKR